MIYKIAKLYRNVKYKNILGKSEHIQTIGPINIKIEKIEIVINQDTERLFEKFLKKLIADGKLTDSSICENPGLLESFIDYCSKKNFDVVVFNVNKTKKRVIYLQKELFKRMEEYFVLPRDIETLRRSQIEVTNLFNSREFCKKNELSDVNFEKLIYRYALKKFEEIEMNLSHPFSS